MLRHSHRIGLFKPANVDPDTGHRRYVTERSPRPSSSGASGPGDAAGRDPGRDRRTRSRRSQRTDRARLDRLEDSLAKSRSHSFAEGPPPPPSGSVPAKVEHRSAAGRGCRRVQGHRRRGRPVLVAGGACGALRPLAGRVYGLPGLEAASSPTTFLPRAWPRNDLRPPQGTVRAMGRMASLFIPAHRTGHDRAHRTSHRY